MSQPETENLVHTNKVFDAVSRPRRWIWWHGLLQMWKMLAVTDFIVGYTAGCCGRIQNSLPFCCLRHVGCKKRPTHSYNPEGLEYLIRRCLHISSLRCKSWYLACVLDTNDYLWDNIQYMVCATQAWDILCAVQPYEMHDWIYLVLSLLVKLKPLVPAFHQHPEYSSNFCDSCQTKMPTEKFANYFANCWTVTM